MLATHSTKGVKVLGYQLTALNRLILPQHEANEMVHYSEYIL